MRCREKNLPVITCGGAGGRRELTSVRLGDLSKASHDKLLSEVRRKLRQRTSFSRRTFWRWVCRASIPVERTVVSASGRFGVRNARDSGRRRKAQLQRWPRFGDVCDGRVWFRGGGICRAENCGGLIRIRQRPAGNFLRRARQAAAFFRREILRGLNKPRRGSPDGSAVCRRWWRAEKILSSGKSWSGASVSMSSRSRGTCLKASRCFNLRSYKK